jgi:hypothetical protein
MPQRSMTRRDWSLSVVALVIAVVLHALFPRYQWQTDTQPAGMVRIDRWTGRTVYGSLSSDGWVPNGEPGAKVQPFLSTDPAAVDPATRQLPAPKPQASERAVEDVAKQLGLSGSLDGDGVMPRNIVNRPRATCADDGAVRTRSGAELGGEQDRRGLGKLQIDNRTGWDAVATLIEDPDGTPRRAIFIHDGARGVITSIRSGRYRLRFQPGSDCGVGRRFCRDSDTSESEEAFDFREVSSESGSGYATYHVTLRKHVAPTITGVAVPATASRFCIS